MTKNEFIEAVKKLGIEITSEKLNQLDKFYEILIRENEKMNLTRIIAKEEVYLKHFYDSLTLVKCIDLTKANLTLCDVGSGAGFPGIVLKIVFPNLKITLIDALQKRVNYLNKTIEELKLENIEALHTRSEDYARLNREKYDIVTARAVAKLNVLSEITIPMVKIGGLFIAMKGNLEQELDESKQKIATLNSKIVKVEEFFLPKEKANRSLVVIKKMEKTSNKYPRKIDKIKKG